MILAGKIYTAYCAAVGGKAFNGDPLQDWDTFRADPAKQKQSDAWMVAATAAADYFDAQALPPGIATKTVGMLVDELITTDIKCFMAQEALMKSEDGSQRADAAVKAQELNRRRNELIRAIDFNQGQGGATHTGKTY